MTLHTKKEKIGHVPLVSPFSACQYTCIPKMGCKKSSIVSNESCSHPGWPLCWQCKIPLHFPDGSQHSSAALGMLSVTHIMPVLVLLSVLGVGMQQCMIHMMFMKCRTSAKSRMDANMQLTINSFRPLFPHKIFSVTFSKIPDSCQIPWHSRSRFSRQVYTEVIKQFANHQKET